MSNQQDEVIGSKRSIHFDAFSTKRRKLEQLQRERRLALSPLQAHEAVKEWWKQKRPSCKVSAGSCHICRRDDLPTDTNVSPPPSNNHTILKYLTRLPTKLNTPQQSSSSSPAQQQQQPSPSLTSCYYCEHNACRECIQPCDVCDHVYCSFCVTIDYDRERIVCLECYNNHANTAGDDDRMDLD